MPAAQRSSSKQAGFIRGGQTARRWRRGRGPGGVGAAIAVNFAPMIDVTFLLLIFFLVTTRFERAEGVLTSDLPRDRGTPMVTLPLSPIVIRLSQTGAMAEDITMKIDHFEHVPQDFEELPTVLAQIHEQPGFDTQTPVVIVADNNVRWDYVVNCWNAALRAGCERIAFAEP
jgi:biopolymer transport protein ExbD